MVAAYLQEISTCTVHCTLLSIYNMIGSLSQCSASCGPYMIQSCSIRESTGTLTYAPVKPHTSASAFMCARDTCALPTVRRCACCDRRVCAPRVTDDGHFRLSYTFDCAIWAYATPVLCEAPTYQGQNHSEAERCVSSPGVRL